TARPFLMNFDRREFPDAVDELARRAGIEVPRETRQHNENPDTRDMFAVLDEAARFYRAALVPGTPADDYLSRRGLDAGIREQFGIGYAPGGFSALKDALGTDPRRLSLLERTGLLSKNDRGHAYDKFRDRKSTRLTPVTGKSRMPSSAC